MKLYPVYFPWLYLFDRITLTSRTWWNNEEEGEEEVDKASASVSTEMLTVRLPTRKSTARSWSLWFYKISSAVLYLLRVLDLIPSLDKPQSYYKQLYLHLTHFHIIYEDNIHHVLLFSYHQNVKTLYMQQLYFLFDTAIHPVHGTAHQLHFISWMDKVLDGLDSCANLIKYLELNTA